MSIQVSENEKFFKDMKIIKNNFDGLLKIFDHVWKMKTKDEELKKIILKHPEIIFETEAPDNIILYYLMQAKKVDISKLSKEEFKKVIPPLSTIRNFRRKIIIDLQKQNVFLENEVKLREKDMYVKEKYLQNEL